MTGRLILLPTPLDFGCKVQLRLRDTLPMRNIEIASRLEYWVCENVKSARSFLARVHQEVPLLRRIQELNLRPLPRELHKDSDATVGGELMRSFLQPALVGHDIGLVSEAGMPAVADPGAALVRVAHEIGIKVEPLVGPISILLALAASGLNGQSFSFTGYLPINATERIQRIRELEAASIKTGQTQLFIEVPHRNISLAQALIATLNPVTRLAIATGLTLEQQSIWSGRVQDWRRRPLELQRLPAIFGIGQ